MMFDILYKQIRLFFIFYISSILQEEELPKLPVPRLEDTLQKYEKTLQALLNEDEQTKLKSLIDKFRDGLGPKLQLYLLEQQQKKINWAYDYWLADMYLSNPSPLPINSNPGMVFPPRKFTTILDVARFTARLLDAALDHKSLLDHRQLPTERATSRNPGQPLCMAQYYRILSSCRLPGIPLDSHHPPPAHYPAEHVIVACRGQLHCVPLCAADRGRLTPAEITAQLLHILDEAPCRAAAPPVGLLTGAARPQWAAARDRLLRDDRNRRNLDLLADALLVVCLDEPLPAAAFNCRLQRGGRGHAAGARDETNLAAQMLHGGGSAHNSANRWFDKTIQLIVSGDGACGLCYEHSQAEGIAVIQLVEKLWAHADEMAGSELPAAGGHLPPPERLEWHLEADDYVRIEAAAKQLDDLVKDLDFQVFRFTGYGKQFIKACQVSPDVYIQLALQLTYYRLNGKLTATYESASTRRFRLGRVDCIRSASVEALAWARAMSQQRDDERAKRVTFHLVSDEAKLRLWRAAVQAQTGEMVANILGRGADVHLLGLREAARETAPTAATPPPALFADATYRLANRFLLSTSQVATSGDTFMGYGPVEADGYGASYNPKADSIVFCLAAFWSSEVTSTSRFALALEESLGLMQGLLTRSASFGQ